MVKKKITAFHEKLIIFGVDKNTTKKELKKIKLLNIFCLVWNIFILLIFLEDALGNDQVSPITYFLMLSTNFITLSLLYKKKYLVAYLSYIIQIITLTFYFSNFLDPKQMLEYYYIFAPPICLILIDNKKINYLVLLISYLCLILPNFYFKHYPEGVITDLSVSFLFFGMYVMVNYFKNLNIKNEAALEAKTHELEKLNAFKSQFFTNISHEIRTPLTLIKGQNEKLTPNLTENQIATIKNAVNTQVTKITEIVNDVLDLAKLETSEFKLHNKKASLTNIIKKMYLSFEPLFKEKSIEFSINTIHKHYYANIDILLIERALNNILVNAYKYTDANGKVSLELIRAKNNVLITVKDTGIGITVKDTKNIFSRFYQVDNDINKAGGSGVGLAFSKEIIELHGGKLTVRSKVNEGSSFRITLPLLHENSITVKNEIKDTLVKNTHIDLAPLMGKTFLIVDDTTDMRNYLKSILTNYTCLEATDGLQALEIVNKNKIDFIITDYMMPKMDGLEFIKALKNRGNSTPILMLTAKADYSSKINVLKLGIDDYMTKPFEEEELLIRIKNALKNYHEVIEYNASNSKETESIVEKSSLLEKIQQYILDNSSNSKLTQDDISQVLNISKSSLYRKIKSETGLSPNEFITEIKLQKARRIIENNTKIPIKNLALEVGFSHISYFSKIYKKRFGVTALKKAI